MSEFDLEQVDRLLTTTRAVRRRLDLSRPVDLGVVLDCVRLATQAPTGANSQRWRWLVVDDPDLRSRLAELYRSSYESYIASRRTEVAREFPGNTSARRILDSSAYLAERLADVPVLVVPCALGRIPAGAGADVAAGFYGSVLPAVWSFQLALRSRGLGSAWTTLHLAHEREAADLLGIPADTVTQVALLPVAHYTGEGFRPAARRPAEEVTYRNRWAEPLTDPVASS